MEYIIGGYSNTADLLVQKSIKFFEHRFSTSFDFQGMIDQGFFLGIIKDKSNETNKNIKFFDNSKVFKSLFYPHVPEILKSDISSKEYIDRVRTLYNDFILGVYDKNKGIKVYKDIFAHEKIYFTLKPPHLFSTSFKLLISMLDVKKINPKALLQYLGNGLNIGEEMVISGIKRLDIGEFLHINNKNIYVYKDWTINKEFFNRLSHDVHDTPYWVDYIYKNFKDAMNFPNDKPILSMMSGGLDSTVITSIYAREYDIPIEALTIKVSNYNEEEVEKAIEIAEFIDIPHHVKEIRINDVKDLNDSYSEIFNIIEEPMGGTAYFSRYFAFKEVKKMNIRNVMLGEGAGEVMSYLRHNVLYKLKALNYLTHIPFNLRSNINKFLHKLYYPSFKLTKFLKNKNSINTIDIFLNSNLLQTKSEIQSFLSSVQFCNVEDVSKITHQKLTFDMYTAANVKKYEEYPFNNYNKYGYHMLNLSPNGDPLISHILSSLYGLKLYCPYNSDLSFKKLLPLPPYIKLTGNGYRTRYKWIVREMAMRKKLLPEKYFEWKPKYGLRQEFFNKNSFDSVKLFALNVIDSLKNDNLVDLRQFEKFFKNITLQNITKHSSEYMKLNIWLGFIGWLATI